MEENKRGSNSKVSTKGMDEHGTSDVRCLQHMDVQSFIGGVEHHLEEGNDDQLEVADTTEQCSHRDEYNSCGKVGSYQSVCVHVGTCCIIIMCDMIETL